MPAEEKPQEVPQKKSKSPCCERMSALSPQAVQGPAHVFPAPAALFAEPAGDVAQRVAFRTRPAFFNELQDISPHNLQSLLCVFLI
jgi:hypothetical protein